MRKLVLLFVIGLSFIGSVQAQDSTVLLNFSEEELKKVFLQILDNNESPSAQEQQTIMTVLKEFQSISQYLFLKYDGTVASMRKIENMWDENIGLQPDQFDEHAYYRAICGYYLILYSSSPAKMGQSQNWADIDYKNKFGHTVYDYAKCREALEVALKENPTYVEKISQLINMYAFVSGKDIPDNQLKTVWSNALRKDKLSNEDTTVMQYLYRNELTKLWELLFVKFKKDTTKRFDLYWDKTFWLQKTPKDFDEHRYYRQFVCTYISDFASQKKFMDESDEMIFSIGFSDYMGCNVLNTQNYYEHPWYRKLDKKRRRLLKKKGAGNDQKQDAPGDFDQRNLG